MGSQHSKEGPDQSHPVAAGWWTEGFLQRQGWMSGQTNFFKANCWPSSENIKVESGKYPHQIQQATDMLAARGILDGEESQAPWSSSLPPRHRPHHHQDSGGTGGTARVSPRCPGVHGGLEHLGGARVHPPPRVNPASPGKASSAGPRSRSRCAARSSLPPNLGTSYSALWFNRGMSSKL